MVITLGQTFVTRNSQLSRNYVVKVFKFHRLVLFQFVSRPTFGFAILGGFYDLYKGKLPCESVKIKCKCHHVSVGSNSRHICTKRPKVEL